jgi:hypothetical protein
VACSGSLCDMNRWQHVKSAIELRDFNSQQPRVQAAQPIPARAHEQQERHGEKEAETRSDPGVDPRHGYDQDMYYMYLYL